MVIGDLSSGEHLGECFQGYPVSAAIALIRAQGPDRGHDPGGGAANGTGGDSACIASRPGIVVVPPVVCAGA